MPPGCHEPPELVRSEDLVEARNVVLEGPGSAGGIDEQQAVPFGARQFDETVLERLEARLLVKTRRLPETAIEAVGPGVVRAKHDRPVHRLGTTRQQLVSPVAAGVGERPRRPVLASHEKHAPAPHTLRPLIALVGDDVAPAEADPAGFEEVELLPLEDGLAGVGVAGKHSALAEGAERGCELVRV